MDRKRVVVSGMGSVSPLGNSVAELWAGLRAGRSGIAPITLVEASDLPVRIAGEVKDFNPSLRMDAKEAKKMDRFSQFAVYSAIEALEDAGLKIEDLDPERTGICLGTGQGGSASIEEGAARLVERGPGRVPPLTIAKVLANFGAANVAIRLGVTGPCQCVVTACAAGTDALGTAMRWIREGYADLVFAGGAESSVTRLALASFSVLQALSTRNDEPERASRPFDKGRDGFVMGEGAGVLVLEDYELARARGARIYCELAGFGTSCDAHHVTAPDPEGLGATRAMSLALADAGLESEDIDYVSAHGTATPLNDPIETKAIKQALGERSRSIKVSSIKSMIGHCIGAGGAIESIATIKAIEEGFIPPTINLEEPDPECDLDYVPNFGVAAPVRAALKNSMGFGGQNSVLAFRKL
jgi:3-oxoacyl-[acyl-carrier-protein] synthase II